MPRPLNEIIAHIRAVSANPSVSTTLIQTEDLLALCDAAAGGWQAIETAPKTDDPILVAFDNGEVEIITDSDETDWQPYDGKAAPGNGVVTPTHWMPVPETPFQRLY